MTLSFWRDETALAGMRTIANGLFLPKRNQPAVPSPDIQHACQGYWIVSMLPKDQERFAIGEIRSGQGEFEVMANFSLNELEDVLRGRLALSPPGRTAAFHPAVKSLVLHQCRDPLRILSVRIILRARRRTYRWIDLQV
jgi:hypothetical protein